MKLANLLCGGMLATALVLAAGGCSTAKVPEVPAATYARGDLEASIEASLDRSVRATRTALEQLKFTKVTESTEPPTAVFVAHNGDDKRIEIRLHLDRSGDRRTVLRIRVGILGEEALSRAILDRIRAAL